MVFVYNSTKLIKLFFYAFNLYQIVYYNINTTNYG